MPFWRSWGAALLGASGVALAVPVGLLLVVAIAAGVSGGVGFRELGQVTAGPALPGSPAPAGAGATVLPTVPEARPARRGSRRTSRAGAAPARGTSTGASTAPDSSSGAGGTPAPRPSAGGVGGSARPPAGGLGGGTTPAPATPSPAAPPATTTPAPSAAVVGGVQDTLEPVPVLGPAAADAVGSVAGLILPPGSLPPRTP